VERHRELEALLALAQAIEAPSPPPQLLQRAAQSLLAFPDITAVGVWREQDEGVEGPRWRQDIDLQRRPSPDGPRPQPRRATLSRVAAASTPRWRGRLALLPFAGQAVLGAWRAGSWSRRFVIGMHVVIERSFLRERLRQELLLSEGQRSRLLHVLLHTQEEEQLRISRELHDQLGQPLTALILSVDRLLEEGADPARLVSLKALTRETLADVRRLSQALRPAQLDELGLAGALERTAREAQQHSGLEVGVMVQLPQRLPAETETVLYRVALEALTNVMRHAKARQASVVLTHSGASVRLVVEDDGVGFDLAAIGKERTVGIACMRERLALLGGHFTLESTPGRGCMVHARVPL